MAIGILIPQDEAMPLQEIALTDYSSCQKAVGDTVEFAASGMGEHEFMLNEEGKLMGLEPNRRATLLWWLHFPAMRLRDHLVGDVVLVGPADHLGDMTDVAPEIRHLLFTPAQQHRVEVQTVGSSAWLDSGFAFEDYFEAAALGLSLAANRTDVTALRVATYP